MPRGACGGVSVSPPGTARTSRSRIIPAVTQSQSLIAAIAETPERTLCFQLFGATANVSAQRATLIRFVRSMSVKH